MLSSFRLHVALNTVRLLAAGLATAFMAGGCVMLDIAEVPGQQKKIDAACAIEGSVRTERTEPRSIVVVLGRLTGTDATQRDSWQLADHFVLEQAGRWSFAAGAGTYGLVAFEDTNGDLIYQQDEPFLRMNPDKLIVCKPGEAFKDIALVIPADGRPRDAGDMDIAALQVHSIDDQTQVTLGQLTVAGEVTTLEDPRFKEENGEMSLWKPFDFMIAVRPGIYFLEPYDKNKIPVVFVHGINGTPTHFTYLVNHLDREKFQPWMYYYPSGGHLGLIADHLTQTMMKLEARYGVKKFLVVAHSMGGLVSRGFILRHGELASRVKIPLFVSLSTPFGGHKGATYGVEMSPAVVRVWEDMAPGSEYLRSIYYKDPASTEVPRLLPADTAHHLIFTYGRTDMVTFGEANDDTATVSSQLIWEVQRGAARLYGFDETHMSILEKPESSALLNELLLKAGKD